MLSVEEQQHEPHACLEYMDNTMPPRDPYEDDEEDEKDEEEDDEPPVIREPDEY